MVELIWFYFCDALFPWCKIFKEKVYKNYTFFYQILKHDLKNVFFPHHYGGEQIIECIEEKRSVNRRSNDNEPWTIISVRPKVAYF